MTCEFAGLIRLRLTNPVRFALLSIQRLSTYVTSISTG